MSEGTSDIQKGVVDPEMFKAKPMPELDEIRGLDSKLHTPNITFQEQHDVEIKLDDLVPKLSEKFGVSREVIMKRLGEERRLQGEADRATEELARAKRQSETIIRTGAKPPEPGTSGPIISTPTQTGR